MRLSARYQDLERDLQQERRLREAGDQQMEMLKSELRKAEDSLARMVKKQMDTETVDKMRKMKNQNESLGAENFEYAVENVGFNIEDKLWIPLWLLCHSAFCLSNLPFCVNDENPNRFILLLSSMLVSMSSDDESLLVRQVFNTICRNAVQLQSVEMFSKHL